MNVETREPYSHCDTHTVVQPWLQRALQWLTFISWRLFVALTTVQSNTLFYLNIWCMCEDLMSPWERDISKVWVCKHITWVIPALLPSKHTHRFTHRSRLKFVTQQTEHCWLCCHWEFLFSSDRHTCLSHLWNNTIMALSCMPLN